MRISERIRAQVRQAAGEIGPYLKINGLLYKIDFGRGRPGSFFRASLVTKDGSLGKQREFTLSLDGQTLTYYKSHKEPKVPVSFENVGDDVPVKRPSPASFKKLMGTQPVKQAVSMVLHAVQKDKEKAKWLAIAVLEDVNAHTAANKVEQALGNGTPCEVEINSVSRLLDWGVLEAAAFGALLLSSVGDRASANKLLLAYIDASPDLWAYL